MNKWKHIKSAPKDRDILLAGLVNLYADSCPFHGIYQGGWNKKTKQWITTSFNNKGELLIIKATHWMPLPKYPIIK